MATVLPEVSATIENDNDAGSLQAPIDTIVERQLLPLSTETTTETVTVVEKVEPLSATQSLSLANMCQQIQHENSSEPLSLMREIEGLETASMAKAAVAVRRETRDDNAVGSRRRRALRSLVANEQRAMITEWLTDLGQTAAVAASVASTTGQANSDESSDGSQYRSSYSTSTSSNNVGDDARV
jgi:hypothetical protein